MDELAIVTGELARGLMGVYMELKLYSLQTQLFARREATKTLLKSLRKKTDKLLDVLQGIAGRPLVLPVDGFMWKVEKIADDYVHEYVRDFANMLKTSPRIQPLCARFPDVAAIRDELVADIHQTLYLYTFH